MQEADHCVGTLPHVRCFINEVVYLTWDTLTALACSLEIHGSRLKGIVRVVDLGVVDTVRPTTRWKGCCWRRNCKEVALDVVAGALYSCTVVGPLTCGQEEVFLQCLSEYTTTVCMYVCTY